MLTVASRLCRECSKLFTPHRPMQAVCGPRCARAEVSKAKTRERAKLKARKEAVKTIPVLIREAQTAFNAWVRARDEGKPCICCGRFSLGDSLRGGLWDCGHYRSTGSASHLRFNEANAHRQLKVCNRHGAGRAVDYRVGLIARIGLDAVEALESNNQVHKWEREELIALRAMYRRRLKELLAQREEA